MSSDPAPSSEDFFAATPRIHAFERVADVGLYRPLPDDWEIGVADVEASTAAIAAGRYKAVNTAGAAAISAVSNAIGTLEFPYVFTGDGMSYAVGPDQARTARVALAATLPWVEAALGLKLRGGVASVREIRAAGHDVRVARYAASPEVSYAMFSGGGLAWAEAQLKGGALLPLMAEPGVRPDLRGLSCRFRPLPSEKGTILSLLVTPRPEANPAAVRDFLDQLMVSLGSAAETARPVSSDNLRLSWPAASLRTEARLSRRPGESAIGSLIRTALYTFFAAVILWTGRSVGGFSPQRYRDQIVANSDFRKYEDGLMMTLDCSTILADAIEARLETAREAGLVDFGLHRQAEALITCVVPSATRADHIHLIDGADGGYTAAARALKGSRSAAQLGPSASALGMPSLPSTQPTQS